MSKALTFLGLDSPEENPLTSPRSVIVTGALAGIGRAAARAFADHGDNVVIAGRRADAGAELAAELRSLGGQVEFVQTDVSSEADVEALVAATVERFDRLDVLVNAAGNEGDSAPITDVTVMSYAKTFDTNVLGTLLGVKHSMRVMSKQGGGNIVNVSSTMGDRGAPNSALYAASKHAVEGLTKAAALDGAAAGVRVNAIAPGPVQTAMLDRLTGTEENKAAFLRNVPLGRAGDPEEIADAILFVSSDRASFITGQIIRVNGGKTAS
ncbi:MULTISPECIES: glucose 1-dehydrogenase [unclassified Mycobacteroides]|uniref:SDR family NAD(P)-dependent oxidoreductase n=1 Tax=unclassified Mycobacteroides TaxID=2618759 RepID=UPI0009EBFC9A|nr:MULTISPECIES: glucose 1-dehydrogenase [unclassified Mycobacteroides]